MQRQQIIKISLLLQINTNSLKYITDAKYSIKQKRFLRMIVAEGKQIIAFLYLFYYYVQIVTY